MRPWSQNSSAISELRAMIPRGWTHGQRVCECVWGVKAHIVPSHVMEGISCVFVFFFFFFATKTNITKHGELVERLLTMPGTSWMPDHTLGHCEERFSCHLLPAPVALAWWLPPVQIAHVQPGPIFVFLLGIMWWWSKILPVFNKVQTNRLFPVSVVSVPLFCNTMS